jgi:enamine deaminase RidA (YjgF/YER057c/UK114 family)
MTIQRISSGGEFEKKIGYCRAVVAGGFVHVAGTVGQGDTVADQCRSALGIISDALEKAGSSLEKAVRVTYYLPDRADLNPAGRSCRTPSGIILRPRPWWNAA